MDGATNLVAKSLVVVETVGSVTRYRLLETTRAYALEKPGELDATARRHAEYYRGLFERADAELESRPAGEWLSVHGRQIDNLRTALDWAFSPSGDPALGVALTVAAVPLWFQQSLLVECRDRAERARASLGPHPADPRREMQLCAALGVSLMQTKGPAPDTIAAWTTALEIAERLGDLEYQLRALWGLWHFRVSRGECRAALDLALRFGDRVAAPDRALDRPVGERMVGTSLHYLGDQTSARRHLESMLAHYVDSARRSHMIRFQYDQPLVARMILARILWLQGFPDQGLRLARSNVVDAQAIGHAVSLCGALEVSSLLEIWSGELEAAERSVAMLLDRSGRSALSVWHARARCLRGVVLVRGGDVAAGSEVLRDGLDELRATDFVPYYTGLLGTMAQALVGVGQIPQGLATIDEALSRDERDEEFWCLAELLRIKAELLLLAGGLAGPGRRRGALPARPRLDPPAGRPLHGAALRGRPRPALARAGADGRRARAAGAGLRTVHRGLRHPGAPGGPGPARPSRLAGRRGTGRGTVWP